MRIMSILPLSCLLAGCGNSPHETDGPVADLRGRRTDGAVADLRPSLKPPPGGLVGYWSFDEVGNKVTDESGSGNVATVRGAMQVAGKIGLAYNFDGSSCITALDSSSLDMTGTPTLSMMAWVEILAGMTCPPGHPGFTNWGVIISKNGEYEHGVSCDSQPLYEESIATNAPGGAWVWNGTKQVSLSNWHHVATTWDGTTARHYLDGVQVETRPVAGKLTITMGQTGLGIGCGNVSPDGTPSATYGFVGTIDEVAIYSRTLSASEIANYYVATK